VATSVSSGLLAGFRFVYRAVYGIIAVCRQVELSRLFFQPSPFYDDRQYQDYADNGDG